MLVVSNEPGEENPLRITASVHWRSWRSGAPTPAAHRPVRPADERLQHLGRRWIQAQQDTRVHSSRGAACARPAGPLTIAQVAGRIVAPRGLDAASRAVRSAMEGSAGRALRHQRAAGAARMRNPAEAGRSVLWEVAGWAALARAAAARARAASQKPVPR
jgi:hypothetical protein